MQSKLTSHRIGSRHRQIGTLLCYAAGVPEGTKEVSTGLPSFGSYPSPPFFHFLPRECLLRCGCAAHTNGGEGELIRSGAIPPAKFQVCHVPSPGNGLACARVSHRHILSRGGGHYEVGYIFLVAWSLWCLFNDRTRLDDATWWDETRCWVSLPGV